jgi:hypothetical protein
VSISPFCEWCLDKAHCFAIDARRAGSGFRSGAAVWGIFWNGRLSHYHSDNGCLHVHVGRRLGSELIGKIAQGSKARLGKEEVEILVKEVKEIQSEK